MISDKKKLDTIQTQTRWLHWVRSDCSDNQHLRIALNFAMWVRYTTNESNEGGCRCHKDLDANGGTVIGERDQQCPGCLVLPAGAWVQRGMLICSQDSAVFSAVFQFSISSPHNFEPNISLMRHVVESGVPQSHITSSILGLAALPIWRVHSVLPWS